MIDITRMTDRSRKVVRIAETEARLRGTTTVMPEHVLLALALEGSGVAAHVLKNLDATDQAICSLLPPPHSSAADLTGLISWNDNAVQAVQRAMIEATRLNHHYIGTEHLVLAIVLSDDAAVLDILSKLNISPEAVCNEVYNLLGHGDYSRHNPHAE